MDYKGSVIKAHYTIEIKTQLDSKTTIPSVKISESHKIYNPKEVSKSIMEQSQGNNIAEVIVNKNEINKLVRRES